MERRLAAILAADVVAYSRLIREDEASTLAALKAHREELIEPKLAQYHGRIVKLMGDGLLAEFPSAVEAVQCAVEIQHMMGESAAAIPEDRRITYRIGINIGDIVVEDDDIFGDGVNIAARLEGLAEPEGICVSRTVFNHVKDKLDLTFEHLGEKEVKNIAEPVSVYRIDLDDKAAALVTPVVPEAARPERRWWPAAIAVVAALVLAVGGALWWQPWKPDLEPASIEKMAFPLPDKPSIAVLPFENLSGDPNQDYLVDGMTETIITELSRFRGLFVIARDSTFNYKGKPVKVQQAAEELGVQFILEGSVQRSADRLRTTAQLIDATTGNHLWAESYDRELSDIFAVQDQVTERIVASLGAYQGELAEAARGRAKRKDPASFSAYDAFLVGMEHKHRFTKADNETAETLFNKAIELDPQFAQAHVGLAWVHIQKFWFGWTDALEQAVAQTREAAQTAIALDPSEAEAHWLLAEAYLADGQYERSEAAFERALALNPNHADLLAGWGYASVILGEPERGIEFIEKAMRLNPHYPDWYDRSLGTAAYMSRRYDDAIAAFRKVTQHVIQNRLYLAASYAQLGRLEEAQAEVAEAMALDPGISVEKLSRIETYRNPADLEHLRDGLRKAGLPAHPPLSLPDKPSIAVLPFTNMSDDSEQEYFADGMTEDLITDLSKISGLFVIARNSSFSYKSQQVKVQQVAEELGVRYVLEGSVRRSGNQVRINAQLIDATTGGHVWAERYNELEDDVFLLQDRVVREIVEALRVRLTDVDKDKLDHRSKPVNLAAYEWLLKGRKQLAEQNRQNAAMAKKLFEKAIVADPTYARSYTNLGFYYWNEWHLWGRDKEKNLASAQEIGHKAADLDGSSAAPAVLLAVTYQYQGDHAQAEKWANRAMVLEPTLAETLGNLGGYLRHANRYREATEVLLKAIKLDPLHPPHWLSWLGHAYFMDDKPDEAISVLKDAVAREPNYVANHVYLAGIYADAGDLENAAAEAKEVLRLNKNFTVSAFERYFASNTKDPSRERRLSLGLRKAGLPE